jgi:hypothetical protein
VAYRAQLGLRHFARVAADKPLAALAGLVSGHFGGFQLFRR